MISMFAPPLQCAPLSRITWDTTLSGVEFFKVEGETRNRINDQRLVFLEVLKRTVGIDQFHQAPLEIEPHLNHTTIREQGTGDRE